MIHLEEEEGLLSNNLIWQVLAQQSALVLCKSIKKHLKTFQVPKARSAIRTKEKIKEKRL